MRSPKTVTETTLHRQASGPAGDPDRYYAHHPLLCRPARSGTAPWQIAAPADRGSRRSVAGPWGNTSCRSSTAFHETDPRHRRCRHRRFVRRVRSRTSGPRQSRRTGTSRIRMPAATARPTTRRCSSGCWMRQATPAAVSWRCPRADIVIRRKLVGSGGVTLQGTYRVPPTVQRNEQRELERLGAAGLRRARTGGRAAVHPAGRQQRGHRRAWSSPTPSGSRPTCRRCRIRPACWPQDTENVGIRDCLLPQPLRGHQAGARRPAPGAQRHRLSHQARHLRRRVLRHRPHRERPLLAVRRALQARRPLLPVDQHQGVAFEFARTDWHYVAQHVLLRLRRRLQVLRIQGRQRQRQLPRPRRRLLPAGGAGRAGAGARAC